MTIKNLYIVLFIYSTSWFGNSNLYAQSYLDSLDYQLKHTTSDSVKLALLVEYSDYCEIVDIPTYTNLATNLAEKLLAEKKYDPKFLHFSRAMANNNKGYYHHFMGEQRESIHFYNLSLTEFKQVPDSSLMALVYNNLAMVYNDLGNVDTTTTLLAIAERICLKNNYIETLIPTYSNIATVHNNYGDYAKSIAYSTKLLKIQEGLDDIEGVIHTYNNLSSIYYTQGDYLKAEEYVLMALSYEEKLPNTDSKATYLYNLSTIQNKLHKDSLAFVNAQKSLNVSKEIDHKKGIGDSYKLMGTYYFDKKEYTKATAYNDSCFNIFDEIDYIEGLSSISKNRASIYLETGDLKKALQNGKLALTYANQLGYPGDIKAAADVLNKIYKRTGDYENAYFMLSLYHIMSDSLMRTEKINDTYKLQIDLEYNQKSFKDSLKNANDQEVSKLKLSEKNAQLEKEQTRNTALIAGLILLLGSVGFIIRAYHKKKELAITIAQQKEVVEQKNTEITDSINYASKIQQAILTSKDYLDKVLKDYFIFYQPKDIVSGDFYWAHQTDNNKLIIAVVDCTGHGVPGAFMSMIGNSLLNEIIIENNITQPARILDKLRQAVIKSLSQSGKEREQRDGMDISLFIWDKTTNEIEYSGANNPLWIVTENEKSEHILDEKKNIFQANNLTLLELKPNKFPIGIYIGEEKPFESISYQLTSGDAVYIATDGFADQFGGPKNKKYKYKTLKTFLTTIYQLPMCEQHIKLKQEFSNWMRDNEQLDDVCNFGFKIK